MPAPILTTKLYLPPPRPGIVLRPRLFERLNAGSKLTIISASAGFGKTTLLGAWIADCGRPVAWLSLDDGDSDLSRFLVYLVSALQTIAPQIGEGVFAALKTPQPPPVETLLTFLLNEISALPDDPSTGSGQRLILVLDDYHLLDSKAVDEALTFLVEHLPPQLHLVIASREDPPLPLARLRVRNQLTELRAADLRFTPAEAAEFLNQMMGLNLSAENIAALDKRTEGWIAGLQLAALSMQGRLDAASFIKSFTGSHHFILDYLVEEVLGRQPEHVRNFLLQTAILDRLSSPLCDAVTGQKDSKGMLETLERGNLFVIPLDDQRQWYRYHHLFAEVLLAHLRETQPDRVSMLHLRASEWYERNGQQSDAVRHALAAGDFERSAGLIELAGPWAEDGSIQQAIWLGWIKRLPEELIRVRPVLNVWYAYVLLGSGDLEAAESRFGDAERWLESADSIFAETRPATLAPYASAGESQSSSGESNQRVVVADPEQFKSLPATIAIGRAYIAQALGNIPDTIRYANQTLELAPEGNNFRRAQASMMLGMAHWASGNLQAAERVFAEYTMKLRTDGNIPDAIGTSVVLADIRLALGHLHEATDTLEQLLQFVMDQGEPIPLDVADLHRELSKLHLEQGHLDTAAHHLQRGRELGEKAQFPVLRYRLCIDQARLKTAQGDLEGALALFDEAQRLYIRSPLPDFCPISAMKARIWIAQGQLAKALEWARGQGLYPDNALSFLREFEHITLARILIAQYQGERVDGSIHEAIGLLDRLVQAGEKGSRMGSVIEILILQALAHQAQGDISSALVPLERALTLAEPEGYVHVFVNEGKPMAELLGRMNPSHEGRAVGLKMYVHKLLAALGAEETHLSSLILQPLIEPLSENELEVLRLLRTELSGPEIARQRMVSLSTIRTHTQHIYAKLGANNRRGAVRRAEELGLL